MLFFVIMVLNYGVIISPTLKMHCESALILWLVNSVLYAIMSSYYFEPQNSVECNMQREAHIVKYLFSNNSKVRAPTLYILRKKKKP